MANPVQFTESNHLVKGGDTGAMDIHVHVDKHSGALTECWSFSPVELEEVKATGRVWIEIHGGFIPPIRVLGQAPFVHGDAAAELLVLRDRQAALLKIKSELADLPDTFFEGTGEIPKLMRRLRDEANV